MPSVLICSQKDLLPLMGSTLLGRGGIDRFKASRLQDAQLLAKTTRPALVLLDRDMPKVREFLEVFREGMPETPAHDVVMEQNPAQPRKRWFGIGASSD